MFFHHFGYLSKTCVGFLWKKVRYGSQNFIAHVQKTIQEGNALWDQNNICQISFGIRVENVLTFYNSYLHFVNIAFYVSRTPSSYFFNRCFFKILFGNGARKNGTFSTVAETSFYVYGRTLWRETKFPNDFSFSYLFLGLRGEKMTVVDSFCALLKNCVFWVHNTNLFFFSDNFHFFHVFRDWRKFFLQS